MAIMRAYFSSTRFLPLSSACSSSASTRGMSPWGNARYWAQRYAEKRLRSSWQPARPFMPRTASNCSHSSATTRSSPSSKSPLTPRSAAMPCTAGSEKNLRTSPRRSSLRPYDGFLASLVPAHAAQPHLLHAMGKRPLVQRTLAKILVRYTPPHGRGRVQEEVRAASCPA